MIMIMYKTFDDANKSDIIKADIIKACKLDEISKYGTVMEYEEFMECVDCMGIKDYDGMGI